MEGKMKIIVIAISIVFLFAVSYTIMSYILLTNEINNAPVIHDMTIEQKEEIFSCLHQIVNISPNTEIVSLQLFSDTRNPSALIVIKTDDCFTDTEFYSTDEFWTDADKDQAITSNTARPFIVINGVKIWPIEATNIDPTALYRLFKYPYIDDSTWVCISVTKNIGSFYNIAKEVIAKDNTMFFLWR
jgi:hypothetical protein